MTSVLQSALQDFERANAHLADRLRIVLDRVCATPSLHGLFMNTLSMMEHIGSRKIMVTQGRGDMDQATLKHLAEETRHAFFMKRHAETAAGRSMNYSADDVIVGPAARMYFQRLELTMRKVFRDPSAAVYLYMSMIVEFRAIWGYGLYQEALDRVAHRLPLKSVLAEERAHLDDMAQRLNDLGSLSADRIKTFVGEEMRGFERLLAALEVDTRVAATGNVAA